VFLNCLYIDKSFKFYFRCIENIGSVVTAFLQDCHEATGFSWQLVGGGLDKSGEIKVVMYTMFIILFRRCLMLVIGVLSAKQGTVRNSRTHIQIGSQA
jgi:hypothetical protein